jgi:transposase
MALSYLPVDRDQLFLLPPCMRDWLSEGHLAWFVIDVVERLDTSVLHARHPNVGVGRRAYDPDMLLGLLIYAYCSGVRSSRQIERLCEVDVAFRVLAAGHAPDHTTIARFRQDHEDVAVQLFCDVLVLCAEAGLAKVGVVAVDGTKIAADASLKANRTRAQIEVEVRAMFVDAGARDAEEDRLFGDDRGDELPVELRDRRRRGVRLDAALRVLDAQRRAREAEQAAARAARREAWDKRRGDADNADNDDHRRGGRPPGELDLELAQEALAVEERRAEQRRQRRAEREARAAATGHKIRGPKPTIEHRGLRRARQRVQRARARAAHAATSTADAHERVNTTDPDSRIMKDPRGWVQGYNAQAAVNQDGIVVAAEVTQHGNDVEQCQPMMAATQLNLGAAGITEAVGTMLFDAGYLSDDNLTADGPDRLIATAKAWKLRRSDPTDGPPPEDATPTEAMQHRLRTADGSTLYAKRQHTVEPVFGDIKHLRGFRRFTRRGLRAVDAEWKLQIAAHNILKMFRHRLTTQTT